MRAKVYNILATAIEKGIEHAWNMHRGYKDNDTPSELHVKTLVEQEIWLAIDEVFDFEDEL